MQKVSDLFEAAAFNPCQVANLENGNAGFRIPEYQRSYDWSSENIDRLMTDIFSGFERLSHTTKASAFTFLGTLILVKDQRQEPKFKGKSFSIVDGQQRLTSLTLVACALIERLRILKNSLAKLPLTTMDWIEVETEYLETSLTDCIVGAQKVKGNLTFPFPRIIRSEDIRADGNRDEKLSSAISIFLSAFAHHINSDNDEFAIPDLGNTREEKRILSNFRQIQKYCRRLNDPNWYHENDCQFLDSKRFQNEGCKKLWEKTEDVLGNDGSHAINSIEDDPDSHDYYRTLMLSAYFCNCIAVTTVITSDETAAFDIFDALNTTGEPLTALETLKPQVIVAENNSKDHKYAGSYCEKAFKELDSIFERDFPETNQKQNETKDLVVIFALYLEGRKISRELSTQRSELRQSFQKAAEKKDGSSEKYMSALAGIAKYRSVYWNTKNYELVNSTHPNSQEADIVKLLSAFISAMKTSLALPILVRYWLNSQISGNFENYIDALKAVSAFLALRRAATGGTDGIDTCFRDIMESGVGPKKFGLCSGSSHQHDLLSSAELKAALKSKLISSKVKFDCRDEWVSHVIDTQVYDAAKPLSRFMLFCATNNSNLDPCEKGLLTRLGVSPSDDRRYFTFENWVDKRYATVEHVAPNSDKSEGWDKKIYSNSRLRNTLGNLVLLPAVENSSIGKASEKKKKIFFRALTAKSVSERKRELESAKRSGMTFQKGTEKIIQDGTRLSMLDGISDVESWSAEFIEKRSRRLAELTWDQLWPWLE